MIRIKSYFDDIPPIMLEDKYAQLLVSLLNKKALLDKNGKDEKLADADFIGYAPAIVKEKLKEIFNGKCAYCERDTRGGAHCDTEHFRPKRPYYWLTYEWTNFLLACQICNRDFKNAQFPVKGKRLEAHPLSNLGKLDKDQCLITSKSLHDEVRLLLHPVLDDPKEHLCFLSNGEVEGITEKGTESINVYRLKRPDLNRMRKDLVHEIRLDILDEYLHNPLPTQKDIKKEIQKVIQRRLIRPMENFKTTQFLGFLTTILDNFEAFIIDNTDNGIVMPDKEIMRQAAREVLQN